MPQSDVLSTSQKVCLPVKRTQSGIEILLLSLNCKVTLFASNWQCNLEKCVLCNFAHWVAVSYIDSTHFYRPQRSCGKVIFSQVCVKNSVHREGGACMAGGVCGRRYAWQGGMCGGGHAWQEKRQLQRTVCILLECILVLTLLSQRAQCKRTLIVTSKSLWN